MEVVLAFEGSRRVIVVGKESSLLSVIESDVALRFPDRDIAVNAATTQIPQSSSKDVYIIQRKTERWGFVDVTDVKQINDGDELTLVKISKRGPGESSSGAREGSSSSVSKDPHQQATQALAGLKKPTPFEAAALGSIFQTTSSSKVGVPSTFDPTRECVFAAQKSKKKTARVKPSRLTLVLLTGKESTIPRGRHRKALETQGRIVKVEFSRGMSAQAVRSKIQATFSAQEDFDTSYRILCQGQDGKLTSSPVQLPSGDAFVENALKHRGNVYIFPVEEVDLPTREDAGDRSSSSDDPELPKISFQRKRAKAARTGPLVSGAGVDSDLSVWRQLRSEQDAAYQQSLWSDQQKDRKAAEAQQLEKKCSDKAAVLREFFASRGGSIQVRFRLPDSRRVPHVFFPQDVPKVLYQFVASLDITTSFVLKTVTEHPQTIHHLSLSPIQSLHLSTVIVEPCPNGPPVLSLLEEDVLSPGLVQAAQTPKQSIEVLKRAEAERKDFLKTLPKSPTESHTVDRENIFSSVVGVFRGNGVEDQFPLRIKFRGEKGLDMGGVYKDMLSLFWAAAFDRLFDGNHLLTPNLHPDTELSLLPVMGKVISHGYLSSGFLPVKIAFPTLVSMLLGSEDLETDESIIVSTFLLTVGVDDADVLARGFAMSEFPAGLELQLSSMLGRYGCRQRPTPSNLWQVVLQVGRFEFLTKPQTAIKSIASGIPVSHRPFWRGMSVKRLHEEYVALSASSGKVLQLLTSAADHSDKDSDEGKVFEYLKQYVGQMSSDEVQRFLRFVTGSCVCSTDKIEVCFNKLKGVARRPIAHTCSSMLVLPSTYSSWEDLAREFRAVLFSKEDEAWKLDGL